jgi:hypothetical protein
MTIGTTKAAEMLGKLTTGKVLIGLAGLLLLGYLAQQITATTAAAKTPISAAAEVVNHMLFTPYVVGTRPEYFRHTSIEIVDDKTALIHTQQQTTGVEDFTVRMLDNCRFAVWSTTMNELVMTINAAGFTGDYDERPGFGIRLKDFAERIESVCTYDRYGKDCPSENWLYFGIDKAWETQARNALEDVRETLAENDLMPAGAGPG